MQNFLKCGTVGWCLEILFTSVDSILSRDWRLMGRTSLLMFPIYGLGALLGPIGRWIDRWLDEGVWEPGIIAASALLGFDKERKGTAGSHLLADIPLRDLALRHGMIDMVLIFCADCQKWYDAYEAGNCEPRKPGAGDLMLAVTDAAIAAQNAVTAAWSLGIGSCYIGDVMERCEIHRELLNLPPWVFPAAMVVFGYPTQQQKRRVKPERCEQEYLVHENTYRRLGEEELRDMLRKNYKDGDFDSWIQAFCQRKYNSDFSIESTTVIFS